MGRSRKYYRWGQRIKIGELSFSPQENPSGSIVGIGLGDGRDQEVIKIHRHIIIHSDYRGLHTFSLGRMALGENNTDFRVISKFQSCHADLAHSYNSHKPHLKTGILISRLTLWRGSNGVE